MAVNPANTLISTRISLTSAALLVVGGLALLFASDVILPRLVPGFPAAGTWTGQLVAAAWLAVASLNWLSKSVLIGGIYGRALVMCNAVLYFVSTMALVRFVARGDAPAALWLLVVPMALFAATYAWLLLRGPVERDVERARAPERS